MNFSVCVDAVFEGKDFCGSLQTLKELGFEYFEFWRWWDKDMAAIKRQKEALGLNVAAFCTRFITLVDPATRPAYIKGLEETIEVAKELGCTCIISQVGDERQGVSREEQHQSLVDGLKACAPLLEKAGVTLVFEPLNTLIDHQGYYLTSSAEAFAIVNAVGSEKVKVIYDIYHQQIMEGNLLNAMLPAIEKIGHFHAAGLPGRNELDHGEINYPEIFKAIAASAYGRCVGLEYFPTEEPATWLPRVFTWC